MAKVNRAIDTDNYGDSANCVDIWIDEPGDKTVRPIPPERLEQARAARDRIRMAEAHAASTEKTD